MVISGTVREGFEVKAAGDIIVSKCVEAARLIAGRDVRVLGGIQGQGKGLVSAGRDVYAEFAQNGRIEAQGTVYINDFSVNSYIFCKWLTALRGHGSIVGGEVYALRGVDVMTLGSAGGAKTTVTAGSDYLVKRKMVELDTAAAFCGENIEKIDRALKPVLAAAKANTDNIQGRNAVIRKTLKKRAELEEQLRIIKAKRAHLEEQLFAENACFVKVSMICHPDVFINIRKLKMRVTVRREHVRFYEDARENRGCSCGYICDSADKLPPKAASFLLLRFDEGILGVGPKLKQGVWRNSTQDFIRKAASIPPSPIRRRGRGMRS